MVGAACSEMPCLPPDEVSRLLHMRRDRLGVEIVGTRAILTEMEKQGMPYLWSIEADYVLRLRQAEARFIDEPPDAPAEQQRVHLDGVRGEGSSVNDVRSELTQRPNSIRASTFQ